MEAFPGRFSLGKKGQASFDKWYVEEKIRAVRYIVK